MQVIIVARAEWIFPFTGLQPAQFRRLVRLAVVYLQSMDIRQTLKRPLPGS